MVRADGYVKVLDFGGFDHLQNYLEARMERYVAGHPSRRLYQIGGCEG
jgi:hypothetical protein